MEVRCETQPLPELFLVLMCWPDANSFDLLRVSTDTVLDAIAAEHGYLGCAEGALLQVGVRCPASLGTPDLGVEGEPRRRTCCPRHDCGRECRQYNSAQSFERVEGD